MWIVQLALRRPYTFIVLALLIFVLGVLSTGTMPVDLFPRINIPVVTVIWTYNGLSPTEMQGRIVTVSERAFTTTVNGIEHIESVSLRGLAITRLYFQPDVPIEAAVGRNNREPLTLSIGLFSKTQARSTVPSLVRSGAAQRRGGLFKVPHSGSLQVPARSAILINRYFRL
jgi:hypothetical protein